MTTEAPIGRIVISSAGAGAELSPCRKYRYVLTRRVDASSRSQSLRTKSVCFVMLNPSTADESADDQTIRKCLGFARRWGMDWIDVVNLFAWRARHPKDLLTITHETAVGGARNDDAIVETAQDDSFVVCAWGGPYGPKALSEMVKARAHVVERLLRTANVKAQCLGFSQGGHPRHPLMVGYDTPLVPFEERW